MNLCFRLYGFEAFFNYDPDATIDASILSEIVLGCIDTLALNYDVSANTNDYISDLRVY